MKKLGNRFWDKVEKVPDGCWIWMGSLVLGYGRYRHNGETVGAHRVSFEDSKGEITAGLQIDHLCRNRCCVNPAHLEAVTQQENIKRGEAGINNAIKTHCPSGHEYNKQNTRIYDSRRYCRQCKKDWDLAHKYKNESNSTLSLPENDRRYQ